MGDRGDHTPVGTTSGPPTEGTPGGTTRGGGEGGSSSPASTEPIVSPTGREVAPGGWRRALTGLGVGLVAGLAHRAARWVDEELRPDPDTDPGRPGGVG